MARLTRLYTSTALVVLSTLVAFLAINVILGVSQIARHAVFAFRASPIPTAPFTAEGAPVDNGRRHQGQLRTFDALAYPDLEPAAVAEVLDDFYALSQRGLPYQPWVQFAEPQFQGHRVTVLADELGLPMRRVTGSMTEGPAVRIYALGGSTTFGYNVADEHTWPSALARVLNAQATVPVEVRNYGRGFYYPSQEVALLVDLLRSGHRPSLVILMDGLNVGLDQDVPYLSAEVADAVNLRQGISSDWEAIRSLRLPWMPMWQVVVRWARRSMPPQEKPTSAPEDVHAVADMVARRFEANRLLAERVASLYGIRVLHLLQPNALVNYPVELYRTPRTAQYWEARRFSSALYARLRTQEGILDLSDLFAEWGHRKALVDTVHYNPNFNEVLARRVAAHVPLKALKVRATAVDAEALTGKPRLGRPTNPQRLTRDNLSATDVALSAALPTDGH